MTPAPKALVFIQDENRGGLYFIESGAADPSTGVRSESTIVAADGGQGLNYLYLGSVFNIPNFPYHVIFLRELRADGAQRDVCIHVPRVSDNLFPPPEGLYPVYEVNHYSAGFPILADDAKIESLGDWAPVYRQWCEHLHQQNTRQFMPVLVQPVPVPVPVYVSEPEFGQHTLAANTPMPLSSSTEIVTKFLQTVPDVATAFATAEQTKAAPTTQKVTVSVAAAGAGAETNTAATQPVSKPKSKTKQTATQSAAYLDTSSDTATRIAEAVSAAEFLASESLAQFDSAVQFFDLEAPANFIKEVRNICLRNIEFVKLLEPNIANSGLGFEKLFAVFTTQINDLPIDEVTLNIYQAILKRFFSNGLASNIIAPLLIAKQDGSNIYNMLEKILIESSLIGDAKTEAKCLESLQSIVILTARLGIKFDETLTQTKSNPNSSKNDFLGFTDDFMDFFDFKNPDNNFARLLIEVDQVDAVKCQKIHEILEKVLELRTRLRVDRVYKKFAVFSYNDILAVLMSETDNEMANFLIHNWLLVNQDDEEILSKLFEHAMVFVPMYLKYGAHSFYANVPDQVAAFRLLDRITKAWGSEQQPALWNSATLRGVTAYLYSNDHDLDMYSDFLTNYLAPMVDLQVASYDNTILFGFAIELQNVFEDIIKNGDKARDILLDRINQVLTIIFDNKPLDVVESAINSKNADGKLFYEMFANQQIGSAVQKFVTDYIRNRRLQEGAASSPRNTA